MPKSERYFLSVHKQQAQRKGASLSFSASFAEDYRAVDGRAQASSSKPLNRVLQSADGLGLSKQPPLTFTAFSPAKGEFLSPSGIGQSQFRDPYLRGNDVFTPTRSAHETEKVTDIAKEGLGIDSIGRPTVGLDYLISHAARSRRSSSAILFPSLESKKASPSKLDSELDKLKVDLERVQKLSGGRFTAED